MGLAGRKQKQRIPADPRNLSWADDASRFGLSYLSKFGWDASQGLGSSGDGMKTHIKVEQKLDMMGIGAQHQRDPNGIAWKQNKEFEALLKRLNESAEQGEGAGAEDVKGEGGREQETAMGNMFVRPQEKVEEKIGNESSVTTKKRKHKGLDDPDTSENTRRKRKEKHQKSSSDDSAALAINFASEPPSALSEPSSGPHPEPIPKPRPMAHRARIRAAKRIAGKPASAISEILGIAPSSSASTSTSTPAPTPPPPSASTPVPQPPPSLDNLTTSTKSVADYFKEKLLARSSSYSIPASSSSSSSGSATPGLGATRLGLGLSNVLPSDDDGEPPRRGIGSQVPTVNADGQDMLTEKQRWKAERKAEKRKRREAEASQATPEGVSTDVKDQMEVNDVENIQRTSKKDKKQKRRREREQQAPADQPNDDDDDITEKSHEHDRALSGSLSEPSKKSKKESTKKRS